MVHLNVHSHYSLLDGVASIRKLIARAVEYDMPALALTDTDGFYGAIPFYQAARQAGINPLIGVELDGAVLLAKNRIGYGQLCELITALKLKQTRMDADHPWPFPFGDEALFLISAERKWILAWRQAGLDPIVGVRSYGDAASHARAAAEVNFAEKHHLRYAALNPVRFLDQEDYPVHRVLTAIRTNTTIDTVPQGALAKPEDFFRSPREMRRLYAHWPKALDTCEWIAEACQLDLPLGTPCFPECPLPEAESAYSWLWKQSFEGLQERYRPLRPEVMERLNAELAVINRLGFAPYFLIVRDIVRFAKEKGISVVGRGSAANSLVAYALGITRVDPLKYHLYFERFMNLDRSDCPDIDLDICWRRRDEVLHYVYERYGADKVAMISTINTFRARAAVREVAKAMGMTEKEIAPITERLPHYHHARLGALIETLPECQGLRLDEDPLKSILEICERIDGFPRHLSIHAGGLVIAPEALTRFTPLQPSAKGLVITQYDMKPIEELGLVKMDLLGHRALSVLADTQEAIARNRGITLDLDALPDADPLTARMLRAGDTIACFQIESPAMRALLKKVGAYNIETVIQCIALVRPGASGSGMKQHFIDRHHGREAVRYAHPALEEVLGETYGVMIYQEDVLKVAHAVAGMNLTEADALRRAMSKKRGPRVMAKSMKRFLELAAARGVEESAAQEIWEMIAQFASYAYCKAHAATYGELAWQCAYLKAHYPVEFLAAVLSNRGGFYAPPVYLEEARRQGIKVYPPHVNHSAYEYQAEGDAIRVGFVEIHQLTLASVKRILTAREEGAFTGLEDFYRRTRIPKGDAEILCRIGAFDDLDAAIQSRPSQLWRLAALYQESPEACGGGAQIHFEEAAIQSPAPQTPDYSAKRRSDLEWENLGLLTDKHPFHYYLKSLQQYPLVAAVDLDQYHNRRVTLAGWLITERRLAVRSGNGVMKFLTLEDSSAPYEAVLFPEVYQRYGALLNSHGPFLLTGEVQEENGAANLIVEHIDRLHKEKG